VSSSHLLILLALFAVTIGDHSAVPNAYVVTMVLAKGKQLNPYTIFATGYGAVAIYENSVYWLGRWMRTHRAPRWRVVRALVRGAQTVSGAMARHGILWLIFGRLVAFLGLYVPFAAGQMGRGYPTFLACTTVGTFAHLAGFGIAAYMLGDLIHAHIARVGFGWVVAGIVALFALEQGFGRHRRARGRAATDGRLSVGQELRDTVEDEDPQHR
jgi:membrane protein DedA with SNARE-associated domain